MSDFIAANPSEAAQKIRKDLVGTINKVKKSKDPKVLNTLKVQLDRLKALGGLDAVVPSEGVTLFIKVNSTNTQEHSHQQIKFWVC